MTTEEIYKIWKDNNMNFTIGTVKGNSVYHNNAVRKPQDYSFEEFCRMMDDEIPDGPDTGYEYDFIEEED